LKIPIALVDFELPVDIADVELGMEFLTDAQAGFTPIAPAVMKSSEAKITGFESFVRVEVEEFTLNFNREALVIDPVNGERCIHSTGFYDASKKTRCYSIFSEIENEHTSDEKSDPVRS
jgi:hypothetical protein